MLEYKTAIYLIIPIFYVILKRYYEKYVAEKKIFSDEECLLHIARFHKRSEYDIFHLSAKNWHISEQQVENDFKVYLRQGQLPHYLRDFIRKNNPPSWSA